LTDLDLSFTYSGFTGAKVQAFLALPLALQESMYLHQYLISFSFFPSHTLNIPPLIQLEQGTVRVLEQPWLPARAARSSRLRFRRCRSLCDQYRLTGFHLVAFNMLAWVPSYFFEFNITFMFVRLPA